MSVLQSLCEKNVAQVGTLYVVATPIGNLSDLSLRAIGILSTCDCIACETPRVTQKLLQALQIKPKSLFTYRDSGEIKSAQHLVDKLNAGQSVALVSDAGTPTISDPGYRLVRLCHENHIPIIPVPGPNAAITGMSISGFPSNQFVFLGFLPQKKSHKQKLLEAYHPSSATLILYESPHRLLSLLEILQAVFEPETNIFIARELSKINETFYRGPLAKIAEEIQAKAPRGEYVILIAPTA